VTLPDDISLRLEAVGKRYSKLEEQAMLLRSIIPLWRPTRSDLWALRGIDLSLRKGETIGIIGHNGAGKTTMLRLLAGVTQPSEGRVQIRGRVAPLISVGVGFHPEMSGRENVYVNGMLLGLTGREIDRRFDEIVAFAELEEFIDTPVKFYSSGMFMRLGFAVAVCSEPDVLLVDEVLAVGDAGFQIKSFERMRAIQAQGTTIVLVSHSTHAIRLMCPRAVLLAHGRVQFDGDTHDAIDHHHQLLSSRTEGTDPAADAGAVEVSDREIVGPAGPTFHLPHDEQVVYRARLHFRRRVEAPQAQFQIFSQMGVFVYGRRIFSTSWRTFEAGETAQIEVPFQQRLGGDTYRVVLNMLDRNGDPLYSDSEGLLVYVAPRPGSVGLADLDATILVDGEEVDDGADLMFERPKLDAAEGR
jgi:ABC-2 type transport system ATP-binding protein